MRVGGRLIGGEVPEWGPDEGLGGVGRDAYL
jgi:hypothetical protein